MTVFEQASLIVTAVLTTATNLKKGIQTSLGAFVWNCFFESFLRTVGLLEPWIAKEQKT